VSPPRWRGWDTYREDSPTGAVRGLLLCDIASAEVQLPEVT
jgi:hypothetical protein